MKTTWASLSTLFLYIASQNSAIKFAFHPFILYLCSCKDKENAKIVMPRKTDGMLFELHPRPTKGEDGKPLLYARPTTIYKKTMDDVRAKCALHGINSGMIATAFETFMDVCSGWIAEGYRIETPLGVFSPKIKLEGDFTDPSKVKGKDVKYVGIEVTPSKRFVNMVGDKQRGFRRKIAPVGNAQMHDEAFMAEALHRSMKAGFTTIRLFMAASGLKYHSAQRYLNSLCLCENPTLRQQKIGGSLHYFPL